MEDETGTGVSLGQLQLSTVPYRLTTSEVCALGRISKRSFARQRRDGSLDINPIARAKEMLWRRDDVIRVFRMEPEFGFLPQLPLASPNPSPAIRPASRTVAISAVPRSTPMSLVIERAPAAGKKYAHLLDSSPLPLMVCPNIGDGGDWLVSYVPNPRRAAEGWPSYTHLPRTNPGPVRLDTEDQYRAILDDAIAVNAEHAALKEKQRATMRKAARAPL